MFFVFGALGLPSVAAVDFFTRQRDVYTDFLLKAFDSRPIDVLYFGDSSIGFCGSRDINRSGIDLLFQAKSGLSVCTIASPGYSAVLYSEYIHLLGKTKFKPLLVIIPINMRSFTGSSVRRPALNFPLRQIYIRYRANGTFELLNYLQYRFLGLEQELTEAWKDQQVVYDNMHLGTNRSIQESAFIPEMIDYAPDRELKYSKQLALRFKYHYMAKVTKDDAMFGYLDACIQYLKKYHIAMLFYTTPINMQDGRRYVGPAFTTRVDKNLAVIEQFMKERGVPFINLAAALPPSCFVDKRDVFEHYTFTGRDVVAAAVAHKSRALLFGNGR